MEAAESAFHDIVEKVCSWFPRRSESPAMSRDFWMPDDSCRVCYDCDSQFSVFNRRHHCRTCGRVFCGKCTQNTLSLSGERERVRVCNFCFKLWQQEAANLNGTQASTPTLTPSSSSRSLASSSTSGSSTVSSSGHPGLMPTALQAEGPFSGNKRRMMIRPRRRNNRSLSPHGREQSPSPYDFCNNRSDDDEDEYQREEHYNESRLFEARRNHQDEEEEDDSCADIDLVDMAHKIQQNDLSFEHLEMTRVQKTDTVDESHQAENADMKHPSYDRFRTLHQSLLRRSGISSEDYEGPEESVDDSNFYTPLYQEPAQLPEPPVDVENNKLIWDPPPPEDEEDEAGISMMDDDDDFDDEGGWGMPRLSGILSSSDYRSPEKSALEEQRKAMRAVVDGHFRALVAQLLNGEGIEAEGDDKESWLEIVTALSLQAATSVKPDTSKGGGMDPGGYVKVKCIATGRRSESCVVKGVVCTKNVANRRMTQRFKNPRFLLLGGALEYQRVSNQLSSLDTLLQQERDHLSMTVARIEAHHPHVLLVEKSVSRFAQDLLLTKEISLVLNVKRPLLERIARCTNAQIVPTSENLTAVKAGHCEFFRVEKYVEEHGSTGQAGKKLPKTLMFFEGCPKPFGCTVLLKGANGDELKKVKRALQFAVFAAYHLGLETSFLADEGASLPDLLFKSPISVALPDKQSKSERSISTIPGFFISASGQTQAADAQTQRLRSNISISPYLSNNSLNWGASGALVSVPLSANSSFLSPKTNSPGTSLQILGFREALVKNDVVNPSSMNTGKSSLHGMTNPLPEKAPSAIASGHPDQGVSGLSASLKRPQLENLSTSAVYGPTSEKLSDYEGTFGMDVKVGRMSFAAETSQTFCSSSILEEGPGLDDVKGKLSEVNYDADISQEPQSALQMESQDGLEWEFQATNQEEFPPSPSDHQSILVSFSRICLRKGSVCERGHLLRIKYYGISDKPLGRFLRDSVFGLDNRCACEEPGDAHLQCFTHRQGSLTIFVQHQNQVLPGEKEGKIWMWHRCLKCARVSGVPPATRRVVMSDAAWGLSFGKFLELSFSNHAAASRVATCGHSLHRDCLRFYGFGSVVACFRYAPINVHSVCLPPSKLEFNNPEQQGWLINEANEVTDKGELVFAEIFDTLRQIGEKIAGYVSGKVSETRRHIAELEALLQHEKAGFEEALQKAAPMKCQPGQPVSDILELNRLRQSLVVCSVQWDIRLQKLVSSLKLRSSTTGSDSILLGDPSLSFSKNTSFRNSIARPDDSQETQGYAVNFLNISEPMQTRDAMDSVEGGVISSGMVVHSKDSQYQELPLKIKPSLQDNVLLNDVKGFSCNAATINNSLLDTSINSALENALRGCSHQAEEVVLSSKDQTERSSFDPPLSAEVEDLTLSKNSNLSENKLSSSIVEGDITVRRTFSEVQFPSLPDLPDTFEAAWTGKVGQIVEAHIVQIAANGQEIISRGAGIDTNLRVGDSACGNNSVASESFGESLSEQFSKSASVGSTFSQDRGVGSEQPLTNTPNSPAKADESLDNLGGWVGGSFASLYRSYSKLSQNSLTGSSLRAGFSSSSSIMSNAGRLAAQGGARILLSLGICDTVIPVYDDEPSSIIAYAITSHEYEAHLSDRPLEKDREIDKERDLKDKHREKEPKDSFSLENVKSHPLQFIEQLPEQGEVRTSNSDENFFGSFMESVSDPLLYSKAMHVKVSFTDDAQGKIKYMVTCYYAKQFDALRKKCCPGKMEFIRSLCRCKRWGAQGGKSNVFFAKTADDRFVIKQVTKTELESFIKFGPEYFKYMSDALNSGSPTCLAKILGIFQVTIKHGKGGKEVRMDLMVMENLLYGRHVTRLYDLKGSERSRYNSDATGKNKVLLDQNLVESMHTNPIFVGNKAKRLLERAVWNDTSFLASVDVMDYSLLVGVDEEHGELVLGIIDFMRQYTWDKHLETWVKASGILGGPKNISPTVISPKQYKKRFRKAMNNYFSMVPDQWSPPTIISGPTQVEAADESLSVAMQDEAVENTSLNM